MPAPKPLISIITPTYNAGKFIVRCMDSVQRQSFKGVEHLIIDAVSTDDTAAQVQSYQQQFQNIRLEIAKDKGVFDAMNKGIGLAQGDWLYFLGADDFLFNEETLQDILPILSAQKNQIVYGNVFFQNLQRLYDDEFGIEKILTRNICHQAIFYHTDVFSKIGFYNLNYRTESDYEFNLRCWLSGQISHQFVPLTIAHYSDGGLSSTKPDEVFVRDYPTITVDDLLSGHWNPFLKIHLLSLVYRKILIRKSYGLRDLTRAIFARKSIFYRIFAFIWMCLSSPFYWFTKSNKSA